MRSSIGRGTVGLVATVLCSCLPEQNGFHVDVLVLGNAQAFEQREVQVEGLTATTDEAIAASSMGGGERQIRVAKLCTTDPVAFRSRTVHLRVLQEGSVISEATVENRACRDVRHPRFDGFVESVMVVLRPNGTVTVPNPRQVIAELTDEPAAGSTAEIVTLPNGDTVSVRRAASTAVVPPPGSPPPDPQPWGRCIGPGPRVDLFLGIIALARPMCGRRPCEHRDLGPSASPRGRDASGKAFRGCER